jgi:polysaccharide export outer membrane protein
MNRSRLASLALGCLLFTACYTPSGAFQPINEYSMSQLNEYIIATNDLLQVRVFQQDNVSSRVRVRADGKISLPFVNDWLAAGKTPTVLALELQTRLKDFLTNPVVTVSLEESRPLTVSVVGEVVRPGTMTLEPGSGVLQALASAGGLTDFAQREGIFVLRSVGPQVPTARIRFTWDALSRGESKASKFTLNPSDVIVAE